MKTLVVYYSRTGNTRKIADELAAALKADVEELKDGKNRGGPIGFLMAGREAMKKTPANLAPLAHDPAAYDLVAVGTPVWGGTICPPVRTFMAQQRGHLKKVAWFCTCGSDDGSSPRKAFPEMTAECGLSPMATLGLGPKAVKGDHSGEVSGFAASLSAHH